jgi:hypothetical protein
MKVNGHVCAWRHPDVSYIMNLIANFYFLMLPECSTCILFSLSGSRYLWKSRHHYPFICSHDFLPPRRIQNAIFRGPDGLSELDGAQNPEKLLEHDIKRTKEFGQLSRYSDGLPAAWSGVGSREGKTFLHNLETSSEAHPASYPKDTECFYLGINRLGCEADH